jgi:enoyl-CoA hydratase/carnithine racemase
MNGYVDVFEQSGQRILRVVWQAFRTVGSDPENEVMILTTKGDTWIANIDDSSFSKEEEDRPHYSYEHMYFDERQMLISLIHDIEIPTIGVIPGAGAHTELALMCDLTICADNTILIDPHFDLGLVPGDGIHSAFIEPMGVKRATYAMWMGSKPSRRWRASRKPTARKASGLTHSDLRKPRRRYGGPEGP